MVRAGQASFAGRSPQPTDRQQFDDSRNVSLQFVLTVAFDPYSIFNLEIIDTCVNYAVEAGRASSHRILYLKAATGRETALYRPLPSNIKCEDACV
jgi:hypothetical protein